MHLEEKTLTEELIYDGKIIKLQRDTVLLENGHEAIREKISHPGGACVVALTEDQKIYLVRQFRYPMQEVTWELPAGKLEVGEDPLVCAIRELGEEVGATADDYTSLGRLYPTPAYDAEIIYIYLAKGLHFSKGQNLDADEFLDVSCVTLEQAVEMVMSGEIVDAKSQIGILKTAQMQKK